ncbi:MAG: hypothetical protein ACE5OZ_01670 [Candidatus Heimdallarchaeota archaeon]
MSSNRHYLRDSRGLPAMLFADIGASQYCMYAGETPGGSNLLVVLLCKAAFPSGRT